LRRPLIAGNWKMHKTVAAARELAAAVVEGSRGSGGEAEVVIAPPYTALAAVAEIARGSQVRVGAQDMHWADQGAFTGAISPLMVAELASHVILGHSERRHVFGETDLEVNRKVHAALGHGLVPIICVGETASERDEGRTDAVVLGQLAAALEGIGPDEAPRAIVAYEPVWAIGTGRACDTAEAARVMGLIRIWIGSAFDAETAAAARILYGGSVTPANSAAYLAQPDIDGALVGGACLTSESFLAIVRSASELTSADK
jgi:triosephosphate isomerase